MDKNQQWQDLIEKKIILKNQIRNLLLKKFWYEKETYIIIIFFFGINLFL